MEPVVAVAEVRDGRLFLRDRSGFDKSIAAIDAGTVLDLTVKPHRDRRSERANAFYWGCVLEPMSRDGSDGDQSAEEIHDAMCAMFLPNDSKRVDFYNRMTGDRLTVETDPRRSSKLKGDEFYDFVEKVRKFALEFMGVRTEDPDADYWRKK